jgi:hypothetical protein
MSTSFIYYGTAILTALYAIVVSVVYFASPKCNYEEDGECKSEDAVVWATDLFIGSIILLLSIHLCLQVAIKACCIAFISIAAGYIVKGGTGLYVSILETRNDNNDMIAYYLLTCFQYVLWTGTAKALRGTVDDAELLVGEIAKPLGFLPSTICLWFVILSAMVIVIGCVWSIIASAPIHSDSIDDSPTNYEIVSYGQLVWQGCFAAFLVCASNDFGDLAKLNDHGTKTWTRQTSVAAGLVLVCQLLVMGLLIYLGLHSSNVNIWGVTEGAAFASVWLNYAMLMTFFFIYCMLASLFLRDNLRGTFEKDEAREQPETDDEFQEVSLHDDEQLIRDNAQKIGSRGTFVASDDANDGPKTHREGSYTGGVINLLAFPVIQLQSPDCFSVFELQEGRASSYAVEKNDETVNPKGVEEKQCTDDSVKETPVVETNPKAQGITKKWGGFWFFGRNQKKDRAVSNANNELRTKSSLESEHTGLSLQDIQLMPYQSDETRSDTSKKGSIANDVAQTELSVHGRDVDAVEKAGSTSSADRRMSFSQSQSSFERSTVFRISNYLDLWKGPFIAKADENNDDATPDVSRQEMDCNPSVGGPVTDPSEAESPTQKRDADGSVAASRSRSSGPDLSLSHSKSVLTHVSKVESTVQQNGSYFDFWNGIFIPKAKDDNMKEPLESKEQEQNHTVLDKSKSDGAATLAVSQSGTPLRQLDDISVKRVPSSGALNASRSRSSGPDLSLSHSKSVSTHVSKVESTVQQNGSYFDFWNGIFIPKAKDDNMKEPLDSKEQEPNHTVLDMLKSDGAAALAVLQSRTPLRQSDDISGKRVPSSRSLKLTQTRSNRSTTSQKDLQLRKSASTATIEELPGFEFRLGLEPAFTPESNHEEKPEQEVVTSPNEFVEVDLQYVERSVVEPDSEKESIIVGLQHLEPNAFNSSGVPIAETVPKREQRQQFFKLSHLFSPRQRKSAPMKDNILPTYDVATIPKKEEIVTAEMASLSFPVGIHDVHVTDVEMALGGFVEHEPVSREAPVMFVSPPVSNEVKDISAAVDTPPTCLEKDPVEFIVQDSMTQTRGSPTEDPLTQPLKSAAEDLTSRSRESFTEDSQIRLQECAAEDSVNPSPQTTAELSIPQVQDVLDEDSTKQGQESLGNDSITGTSIEKCGLQSNEMRHASSMEKVPPMVRKDSNLSTVSQFSVSDLKDKKKKKQFVDKNYRARLVRPLGYSPERVLSLDEKKMDWAITVAPRAAIDEDNLEDERDIQDNDVGRSELLQDTNMARDT